MLLLVLLPALLSFIQPLLYGLLRSHCVCYCCLCSDSL
jgi:hypothetical protein